MIRKASYLKGITLTQRGDLAGAAAAFFAAGDYEDAEEQANALGAKVEEAYPMTDVEVHYGGQPIYYYILSVE